MKFHEKLRKLCSERHWGQSDLIAAVGNVSKSTMNNWFNGKSKPELDSALRVAKALNVSLDYLADDSLDEPPAQTQSDSLNRDEFMIWEMIRMLGYNEAKARLMDIKFVHVGDHVIKRDRIKFMVLDAHAVSLEVLLMDGRTVVLEGEEAVEFLRQIDDHDGYVRFRDSLAKRKREEEEERARLQAEEDAYYDAEWEASEGKGSPPEEGE